ncbi:hypothetical protein ACFV4N_00565 [Actinosynnema sp. NPDC059797]
MNLRKTIAGVAVTLGSTAVALGLGGTAQAADVGVETRPDIEAEPGRVAGVGDVIRVDTNEVDGLVRAVKSRDIGPEGIARLARDVVPPMAEKIERGLPVDVGVRVIR